LYVGDSYYDIRAAKTAGIRIILNTYVYKAEESRNADFIAKDLKEVKRIIEQKL